MPHNTPDAMLHEGPVTAEDIEWFANFISAMCKGDKQWRMCVPVQRDDADMVCTRILHHLRAQSIHESPARQCDEPSDAMIRAGFHALNATKVSFEERRKNIAEIYKAMLAATPQTPPSLAKARCGEKVTDEPNLFYVDHERWPEEERKQTASPGSPCIDREGE